jgi:RNA polymerase sigma-70 factor, ECF subfamily
MTLVEHSSRWPFRVRYATSSMYLAAAFASELAAVRPLGLTQPELQAMLEQLVDESRAAWPELEIEPADFVRYLAARISPEQSIPEALDSLHVTDLYLAYGCVRGNPKAIAALDGRYISTICSLPFGANKGGAEGDEVAQRLRVRTLVGNGQSPPRIASYSGRGPLARWIRAIATRLAADLRRMAPPTSDETWSVGAIASDAEPWHGNERYGDEFSKALEAALLQLTRQARTLLQLHFLENVGAAQIAESYGVSARTVQRRIAAAENQIVQNVRSALAQRLDLSSSQLQSLLPDVEAELVVVLRRFFSNTS